LCIHGVMVLCCEDALRCCKMDARLHGLILFDQHYLVLAAYGQ
jgi:hypothetical protein